MAKLMPKAAALTHLAARAKMTKTRVARTLDELHRLAARQAKKGGFILPGFGKLVLVSRKARRGRNPRTGQPIQIPAKRVVRVRVAKAFKDAILGGKR